MYFEKKINFEKLIILSFLILLVIFYTIRLDQLFNNSVNHATSWWLYNYEYGLTRRGLIGQLLFYFSTHFDVNILNLLQITQTILFSIFIFLIGNFILKKNISIYFFLYFFSPSLFLIYINDIFYIARQEIFLFIFFSLYIFKLKKSSNNKYSFLIDTFIFSLLTLIHEAMIFYFSYFFIANLIFCKKKIKEIIFNFLIHFIVCASITFALINTDSSIYFDSICNEIIQLGGHLNTCDDLKASSLNLSISKTILLNIKVIISQNYLFNYFLQIVLSLIPLLYMKKFLDLKEINIKKILLLILFSIFFSLPLFYLAYDWGRWIHINLILIFIILINFLPKKENNFKKLNLKNNFYLIICIIVYSTTWSIPVCCEDEFIFGLSEKINTFINKN